jgi:hypothetical protein
MPGFLHHQLRRLTDHYNSQSLASQFRRKRIASFAALLNRLSGPVHILDVGGDEKFWDTGPGQDHRLQVTLLNLLANPSKNARYRMVRADARFIPFPAREFDVVFSNSVIEHLGSYENQRKMADEIRRVGKRCFVQTPSKWFPLEPHFLFPAFQFLPFSWRVWIASHYAAGWYCHPGDPDSARKEVESIRLLTKQDCTRLFPGSTVLVERLFGFPKSYLIIDGW